MTNTKQNDTPRLIAERIANELRLSTTIDFRVTLADAIEAALNAERERCAKIAEKQAAKGQTIGDTKAIAARIRGKD